MTKSNYKLIISAAVALFLLPMQCIFAASIDSGTAKLFVESWLAAENNPVMSDGIAREVQAPIAVSAADSDAVLAFALNLSPKGYVIVAADDRLNPLVAFGAESAFELNPAHPLYAMMLTDLTARIARADAELPEGGKRGGALPEYYAANKSAWAKYLTPSRAGAVGVVQEHFVDQLMDSQWSQVAYGSQAVYNYYTPGLTPDGVKWEPGDPNNAASGCTQTATGQIMRYFRWPQSGVGNVTKTFKVGYKGFVVDGVPLEAPISTSHKLLGGDGNGGPYKWELMTPCPSAAPGDPMYQEASDENYQAIGALLFDIGAANGASYFTNAHETGAAWNPGNMRSVFKYMNAGSGSNFDYVRANLDAGRPLGISISVPITLEYSGHAIVCDGYGRSDGRWYYHMNFGWAGGSDGWYNWEEYVYTNGSTWGGFSVNVGNVYRQRLQVNDSASGGIISGRVTDANGNPVAGVKVTITKAGETDVWQSMLAWYDAKPGVDKYAQTSTLLAVDEVEDSYRNCTNEYGIWAIDKVASGNYIINLSKDGYNFLGDATIAATASNVWGKNFIAVPDSIAALALENWWIDGNTLYLQFNRPVGSVMANAGALTLGTFNLGACPVTVSADSDIITLDITALASSVSASDLLRMTAGFLAYDIDGASPQAGMYDAKPVFVAPVVTDLASGSAAAVSGVTAITRGGAPFSADSNVLIFEVTSSDDISPDHLKVVVSDSYDGIEGFYPAVAAAQTPTAVIDSWDYENGLLTVNVGTGIGFVRVDYIPAVGTAFTAGEAYRVNNVGPSIISAKLSTDSKYVDITFNKVVGNGEEFTSLTGTKAADLEAQQAYYRYTGTLAADSDLAIWKKGISETGDNVYFAGADGKALIGTDMIADGTTRKGTISREVKVSISVMGFNIGSAVIARVMHTDVDGDGNFDPSQDGIFLQFCDEMASGPSGLTALVDTSSLFPSINNGTFTSNEYVYPGSAYQQMWLSNTPAPGQTTPAVQITSGQFAYYTSQTDPFPATISIVASGVSDVEPTARAKFEDLTTWFANFMNTNGDGAWIDRAPDTSLTFNAAHDIMIIGAQPADGTAGTALPASVYFLDLDGDNFLSANDFVWNDGDSDGKWLKTASASDVRINKVKPENLNWMKPLDASDFIISLHNNGGTVENAWIDSITSLTGAPLQNASATFRAHLKYAPEFVAGTNQDGEGNFLAPKTAATSTWNVPAGVETIEIHPYADSIFDAERNAAPASTTTGELVLKTNQNPRVTKAAIGFDNYSLALRFSQRIYPTPSGVMGNAKAISEESTYAMTDANLTAEVLYDDGATEPLQLTSSADNWAIRYELGTNFMILDFATDADYAANLKLLDPVYQEENNHRLPKAIVVKFAKVYNQEGLPLADASVQLPVRKQFAADGLQSLPPPVFTNLKNAYFKNLADPSVKAKKDSNFFDQNTRLTAADETGVEYGADGLEYYGLYYRDLDADGRIDAIDLNFHNPYGTADGLTNAKLVLGPMAQESFKVWYHFENLTDTEAGPNVNLGWSAYNNADGTYRLAYPQDAALKTAMEKASPEGWAAVEITGIAIIAEDQQMNYVASPDVEVRKFIDTPNLYTTVRISLNQDGLPARTAGDNLVSVAYLCPRANSGATYDGKMVKQGDGNMTIDKEGSGMTDTEVDLFALGDEVAGIYWVRSYDSDGTGTFNDATIDDVWVCDSFGPVMAWDGAPAVPVSAFAWRATPYAKMGEADLANYEYVDVSFTEALGLVDDRGLAGAGYNFEAEFLKALRNGPFGATLINDNTVRFTFQYPGTAELDLKFAGAIYPLSGAGIEHQESADSAHYSSQSFEGVAAGLRLSDVAYQVTGNENDQIEVFSIENISSTIKRTNISELRPYGAEMAFTVKPVSRKRVEKDDYADLNTYTAIKNGGAWALSQLKWTVSADLAHYSVSVMNSSTKPGASFYAGVSGMTLESVTVYEYGDFDSAEDGSAPWYVTVTAPAPTAFQGVAASTALTPRALSMTGPIFNMVKAGAYAVPGTKTSRINSGDVVKVIGIDAAAPAGFKLSAVTVRVVSTGLGQFDPAIDLKPLADGETSGLYLYDETANAVIKAANNGLEWSAWKTNEAGLPYREVTIRPLAGAALPTVGGGASSYDLSVVVVPSDNLNLGDSFYVEIPDNGIAIGTYSSADANVATWGTSDGTQGYPFTDSRYLDINGDRRWSAGEPIARCDDIDLFFSPIYDGGKFANLSKTCSSRFVAAENGINSFNLYYAKKNGAVNAETYPVKGYGNTNSFGATSTSGASTDFSYNVSYEPGDDIWFDIGGRPGVYDAGIDIPLFGNADKFVLPWAVEEAGAASMQFRGAANSAAKVVTSGSVVAPSGEPVAIVGVNMQDSGRGFGPRYILGGSVLVEVISKNTAAGEHSLKFTAADSSLAYDNGAAVAIPAAVGGRAILKDAAGTGFVVIRRMADIYDNDEDGDALELVELPAADAMVTLGVSEDTDRDASQPEEITGLRILAVGSGNAVGTTNLVRTGTKLSWNGGASVDVADGGIFVLPGVASDKQDYLTVQVSVIGGATSEAINVYTGDGLPVSQFQNITGLEIMAVSDMIPQGWYQFGYENGMLSFGNAGSAAVPADGDFAIVYGDGVSADYPRNYVVIRRTAAVLPSAAVADQLFINQTQLFQVNVTVSSVNGVTPNHFAELTNDPNSGVSLWWDADASGAFSTADMFVPLAETPVLTGGGDSWSCVLRPDTSFLTAWLSRPKNSSLSDSCNFFVCVRTTADMSYGDQFRVAAKFFEPSEPNYDYNQYDNGKVACFAQVTSSTVTCTSVTNTIIDKRTIAGQTVDADTIVPLFSITHFVDQTTGVTAPHVTSIDLDLYNANNFDPATALKPLDLADAAARGIIVFKDNGDGVFNAASDIPVASTINANPSAADVFKYTVQLSDESLVVPEDSDPALPSIWVAIQMSEDLPFDVTFYARMENDSVVYDTGSGIASSAVRSDNLTSTIHSEYSDITGATQVGANFGLVINSVGSAISGYQEVSLAYDLAARKYTLNWNGNAVEVDMTEAGTYTLGTGDNAIVVTFDPNAFRAEDRILYTEDRSVIIPLDAELTNIVNASNAVYYSDDNADGKFTPEWYDGALLTNDALNAGTASFALSDKVAFWDANEDGAWDAAAEPLVYDTDGVYTLPWMSALVDTDSALTQGCGIAAVTLVEDQLELIAGDLSPMPGDDYANASTVLYYIDADANDKRGYDERYDVVIARTFNTSGTVDAADLVLQATDSVVLFPGYEEGDAATEFDVSANLGAALTPFIDSDFLRMNYAGSSAGKYSQRKALFAAYDDTYVSPEMTWEFLANPSNTIRRYTPASVNTAFQTVEAAMSPVIALDFANSGANDVALTSVKVRFFNVDGFSTSTLCALAKDATSGVQLWKDADGNGVFDPYIDALVPLASVPTWGNENISGKTCFFVTLSPAANNSVDNEICDGINDFFVVVVPSTSANSSSLIDDGNKFTALVGNSDIVLNKAVSKTAAVATGIITIDSKPPMLVSCVSGLTAENKQIAALTFDEAMRKVKVNDTSVWSVTDKDTGDAYDVESAELSADNTSVVLSLLEIAGNEYSTAGVNIDANFTLDTVLADWANNPAELAGVASTDLINPFAVAADAYDMDANRKLDRLVITFSECVLDSSFADTEWKLGEHALTLLPADNVTDKLNDKYLVFAIAEGESFNDDCSEVLDFGTAEQLLTDVSGNRLDGSIVPVVNNMVDALLIAVEQDAEAEKQADDTYTLKAGTNVTLTFSQEVVAEPGAEISGIRLVSAGKDITLNGAVATATFSGNDIVLNITNDITGFTSIIDWKIVVDPVNAGVLTLNDRRMAATEIKLYPSVAPTYHFPVADAAYYGADGELVPNVSLGRAIAATNWQIDIYAGQAADLSTLPAPVTFSGTDLAQIDDDTSDNIVLDGWYAAGNFAYTFVYTFTGTELGTETYEIPFAYIMDGDTIAAGVSRIDSSTYVSEGTKEIYAGNNAVLIVNWEGAFAGAAPSTGVTFSKFVVRLDNDGVVSSHDVTTASAVNEPFINQDVIAGTTVSGSVALYVDAQYVDGTPATDILVASSATAIYTVADDIIDTDNDGLPDVWEIQYFGSLDVSDGTGDFDNDLLDDYNEYKMGYDPTNVLSLPRSFYTFVEEFDGLIKVIQTAPDVIISAEGAAGGTPIVVTPLDPTVYFVEDSELDFDGDGITNLYEIYLYHTTAYLADTDGDGIDDGVEINLIGSDPLDQESPWFNRSLDLITAAHAVKVFQVGADVDGDGIADSYSWVNQTLPDRAAPYALIQDFNGQMTSLLNYTIEFWFKLDSASGLNGTLIQKTVDNPAKHPDFWVGLVDGKLTLKYYLSSVSKMQTAVYPEAFTADGLWYHAAIVVSQDTLSLPLNYHVNIYVASEAGELETFESGKKSGLLNGEMIDGDLVIGDLDTAAERLSFQMDELRIWNASRSYADIQNSRNSLTYTGSDVCALHLAFNSGNDVTPAETWGELSRLQRMYESALEEFDAAERDYQTARDVYEALDNPSEEQTAAHNAALVRRDNAYLAYIAAREDYLVESTGHYGAELVNDAAVTIAAPEAYLYADMDSDGIQDWWEITFFGDLETATASNSSDNDEDGLSDYYEWLLRDTVNYPLANGADPTDPWSLTGDGITLDGEVDSDSDGLANSDEMDYGCDPTIVDTDDDGISDKIEVDFGASPVHPISVVAYKSNGQLLTDVTWDSIKDTDLSQYVAATAPYRYLDLGALAGDIELADADRFAVGTYAENNQRAISGVFTLEMWVKAAAGTEDGTIFETKADTGWGWRLKLEQGAPKGEIFDPSGTVVAYVGGTLKSGIGSEASTPALAPETWTHLALVWNAGSKGLTLYRDKLAIITSRAVNYAVDFGTTGEYAKIGKVAGVAVDELRFWTEARTDAAIEYWAERIIPSPLNSLITYFNNAAAPDGMDYVMLQKYPLRAYFRFDDGGKTVEDFAHFQKSEYHLTVADGAIVTDDTAKAIKGIDDIDGDGMPEWWVQYWKLSGWRNAQNNTNGLVEGYGYVPGGVWNCTERFNGDWRSGLVWNTEGTQILGITGYQYGVGYTPLGGSLSAQSSRALTPAGYLFTTIYNQNPLGEMGHADGSYTADNQILNEDMALVTMFKYIVLENAPTKATMKMVSALGASVTGVIINSVQVENANTSDEGFDVTQYLKTGRNQIVIVWSRIGETRTHKIPAGTSTVDYNRTTYRSSLDVGLNVDGTDRITLGYRHPFDPRSAWYYRATTSDQPTLAVGAASWGNRSTDNNSNSLNNTIDSVVLDPSAPNYAIVLDQDGDGIQVASEYLLGTNPRERDSDNNGIFDGQEDYESDGITNYDEIALLGTDPKVTDTDNDGISDRTERAQGSSPVDWNDPFRSLSLVTDATDGCYLLLPLQSRFALASFTLEALVKPAADDADGIIIRRIVGTVDPAKPLINYELGLEGGKPYVRFTDKNGDYDDTQIEAAAVNDQYKLQADTWNHVAATYDSSTNLIYLYINGTQVAFSEAAAQPLATGSGIITTRVGENFDGMLDELRIWNSTRNLAAINSAIETTLGGDETGLVAYYRFDEADLAARESNDPNSPYLKYCADSTYASLKDWQRDWANAAILMGTATTFADEDSPINDEVKFVDEDGDGIADWWEIENFGNLATADAVSDTDGDGLKDITEFLTWDTAYPTDPNKNETYASIGEDTEADSDGDGLSNFAEQQLQSHPGMVDTDDDGIDDGVEAMSGMSPVDSRSKLGLELDSSLAADSFDYAGNLCAQISADNGELIIPDAESGERLAFGTWNIEARFRVRDLRLADQSSTNEIYIIQRAFRDADGAAVDAWNYAIGFTVDTTRKALIPFVSFKPAAGDAVQKLVFDSTAIALTEEEAAGCYKSEWVFLTGAYTAAARSFELYLDGELKSTKAIPANALGSAPTVPGAASAVVSIGKNYPTNLTGTEVARLLVDEVRIWGAPAITAAGALTGEVLTPRTAEQILAGATAPLTIEAEETANYLTAHRWAYADANNLAAYFRFDDEGNSIEDYAWCADWMSNPAWKHALNNGSNWVISAEELPSAPAVSVYVYSAGAAADTAYVASAENPNSDVVKAQIDDASTDPAGGTIVYQYFWLKSTAAGYLAGDLTYTENDELLETATGNSVSAETILSRVTELKLEDTPLAAGDYLQLAVAAVSDTGKISPVAFSNVVAIKAATATEGIPGALVLVSPLSDVTGLKARTALTVTVRNDNAVAGIAHITWFKNMMAAKTSTAPIGAGASATLTMADTAKVEEGDVWSFKVWFEDTAAGARSLATPEEGWVYMMIGTGYDNDEAVPPATSSTPNKPARVVITPAEPDPSSIIAAHASGSNSKVSFNYYYQWYYRANTSTSFVLANGQNLPYWDPVVIVDSANADTGITNGGFSSYVLDPGDQLYCTAYAMNINAEESDRAVSNVVTIGEVAALGAGMMSFYEFNDSWLQARPIYSKTNWFDPAAAAVQTHTFKSIDDQDWCYFILGKTGNNAKWNVTFETNAGVMFGHGYTKSLYRFPNTALALYKLNASGTGIDEVLTVRDFSANDGTGDETVFARFENVKLEPGIYYISVWDEFRSTYDVNVEYQMHLMAQQVIDARVEPQWDLSELAVGEYAAEIAPITPGVTDDLTVSLNAYAYDGNGKKLAEKNYYYLWYRNGIVVPFNGVIDVNDYTMGSYLYDNAVAGKNTIPASMTREGDTWQCVVFPYTKEYGFGEGISTNVVTIGKSSWQMTLTDRKIYKGGAGEVVAGTETVTIGWNENATFGFDAALDNAAASLTIPAGDGTYTRVPLETGTMYSLGFTNETPYLVEDFRPYGKSSSWFIICEMGDPKADSISEFALAWDASTMPESAASGLTITQMTKRVDGYYDMVVGSTVKVEGAGEIVLTESQIAALPEDENGQKFAVFRVTIGTSGDAQTITLKKGWNLIALPLTPLNNDVNDVFSVNGTKLYSGSVWQFEGGKYVAATSIVATRGYWLYSKVNTTISVYGNIENDAISLAEGWNIIGPVYDIADFTGTYKDAYPAAYSSIATNSEGGLEIYKFVDGGYGLAVEGGKYTLKVGNGYWIKANTPVELPVVK